MFPISNLLGQFIFLNEVKKTQVKQLIINSEQQGRRIDNFLVSYFKTLPKSRVYQMIRKGEVRVNKGRIKADYKLQLDDTVRIPPVTLNQTAPQAVSDDKQSRLINQIIHEDDGILVLNKPAGVAVHSGSKVAHGVIEILREARKDLSFLELVHRLDKPTSGCLLLAKSMSVLRALNEAIVNHEVEKHYLALLAGEMQQKTQRVEMQLQKNQLRSGERMVRVDEEGKESVSVFHRKKIINGSTLVKVELHTGRTHQIRVHAEQIGHPIIGDEKYGEKNINQQFRKQGIKRLCLHAETLRFVHPLTKETIEITAPLDNDLNNFINSTKRK